MIRARPVLGCNTSLSSSFAIAAASLCDLRRFALVFVDDGAYGLPISLGVPNHLHRFDVERILLAVVADLDARHDTQDVDAAQMARRIHYRLARRRLGFLEHVNHG